MAYKRRRITEHEHIGIESRRINNTKRRKCYKKKNKVVCRRGETKKNSKIRKSD